MTFFPLSVNRINPRKELRQEEYSPRKAYCIRFSEGEYPYYYYYYYYDDSSSYNHRQLTILSLSPPPPPPPPPTTTRLQY